MACGVETAGIITPYVRAKAESNSGQSTVEYVVVLAAFLALVVGLGAMSHLLSDGVVADHALFSASHCVSGETQGALLDVFSF